MTITAKAPGKLYVAGEYAILDSRAEAIVAAVDRFVTCSITDNTRGVLHTRQADAPIAWRFSKQGRVLSPQRQQFAVLFDTLELFANVIERPFACTITIESTLDSTDGTKYGLGSSAAVTIALIDALCQYFAVEQSPAFRFKLAALSHYRGGHDGSFGDLAASAYGGLLRYHNFDHQLLSQGKEKTGAELHTFLAQDWPGFAVTPLELPEPWRLAVVWTGTPAETAAQIHAETQGTDTAFDTLVRNNAALIPRVVAAFEGADYPALRAALADNQRTLFTYTEAVHKPYQTPRLERALSAAGELALAAKISGAGNGDCLLAICPSAAQAAELRAAWRATGLTPLPLSLYKGASHD